MRRGCTAIFAKGWAESPQTTALDSHFGLHTRRGLLRNGALALVAVGATGAAGWEWLLGPRQAASGSLRRCVSLGANGVINPGSTQDYRSCRPFLLGTGTTWVRLWADWPSLQPESHLAPDRGSGAWRLLELDKQIAQANADGISVILCSYRFPTWANGTASLTAAQDAAYRLEDRIAEGGDPASRKGLHFKLPADFGANSAWASWIEFLVRRYSEHSPSRRATIAALELVNEPNAQVWPLEAPSGTTDPYDPGPITVHRAVAQMFETAQSITGAYRSTPMLVGPATSDRTDEARLAIGYATFTAALLDELACAGFEAGPRFAWSHHNYTDVEYDQGSGSLTGRTSNRAATVRQMLVGRWAGWPHGDALRPAVLIPEGGARLTRIASVYGNADPAFVQAIQADLIQRNWDRMSTETEGAGIEMVGQYLFHTDPHFDSGLFDVDGSRRPAYSTWARLPSFP